MSVPVIAALIIVTCLFYWGIIYLFASNLVLRCTVKAGAIVRMAPREDAPIYYVYDNEESGKRYKYFELLKHPGWIALKSGGYVQNTYIKSIGNGEFERNTTAS